jgi:hypothetical protein
MKIELSDNLKEKLEEGGIRVATFIILVLVLIAMHYTGEDVITRFTDYETSSSFGSIFINTVLGFIVFVVFILVISVLFNISVYLKENITITK